MFFLLILIPIILIIFCFVFPRYKKKKKAKMYISLFKNFFMESKDIRKTMEQLLQNYKRKSPEALALRAGIYYLDVSMLKDYKTALQYMYYVFEDTAYADAIEKLHISAIEYVRRLRTQSALPQK